MSRQAKAYRTQELERAVRFELTITGFAVQSLWPDLATRARVISNLGFRISDCGAEREIRTLEASLEDSHVSSYIIPACSSFDGAPGGIRTHNLDVRSVAPIQLSFGSSLLRAASARACCLLVREDRIELSPRVSRTRMLALHHARKRSPKSHVACLKSSHTNDF